MHAPFRVPDQLRDPLRDHLDNLQARLAAGLKRLPLQPRDGLVSLLLALPNRPTSTALRADGWTGPQFQFQHQGRAALRGGYGVAAEWSASGPARLPVLAGIAQDLRGHWTRVDADETGLDAFAMLGFAASAEPSPVVEDHLPNALLWVPEVGVRADADSAALVFTTRLPANRDALATRWHKVLEHLVPLLYRPASLASSAPLPATSLTRSFAEPNRAGWRELVLAALAGIERGTFEKVVVSRRVDLCGSRAFAIDRLLSALGEQFPTCQIIHLQRNGTSFVSATPERLLARHGTRLEVDAIAGTARRDADPVADAALAEALQHSDKNLREHRVVIDAIRDALSPPCNDIQIPPAPRVLALRNAHHLWSPIRARAPADCDLFALADRLHPTPATNGEPRTAARDWLATAEPFARGWYTGAAGILGPDLDGELWVLLRCARVCGARAELYAGAGIVAGSDPAAEWAETEAKLGAMLSALRLA